MPLFRTVALRLPLLLDPTYQSLPSTDSLLKALSLLETLSLSNINQTAIGQLGAAPTHIPLVPRLTRLTLALCALWCQWEAVGQGHRAAESAAKSTGGRPARTQLPLWGASLFLFP